MNYKQIINKTLSSYILYYLNILLLNSYIET